MLSSDLLLTATDIRRTTEQDPVLHQAFTCIQTCRSSIAIAGNLYQLFLRRASLSEVNTYFMIPGRVVNLSTLRPSLLHQFHAPHPAQARQSQLPPVLVTGRVPTATSKTRFVTSLKANKVARCRLVSQYVHYPRFCFLAEYGQRHRRPGSSLLSKPTRYQDAASSANMSITPGFDFWQGTDSDIEDPVRHFSQSQQGSKMPPRYRQRHRRPGSSLLSKPTRYQDAASSANKSITPGFAYWQGTDSDIEDLVRHYSQSQQGTKMPPRQPISPLPPVLLPGRVRTATSKTWFVTILKANKGTDSDIEDPVRHFSQSQQGSKMPPRQPISPLPTVLITGRVPTATSKTRFVTSLKANKVPRCRLVSQYVHYPRFCFLAEYGQRHRRPGYGQRHRRPGSSLLSKPTSYQDAASSANKSITNGFDYWQGTDSDIEDPVRHFSQSQQGTKMPPRYGQRHRRPGSSLLSKPTRYQDAASSANKSITPGFAYWQGTDSDIEDLVRHFSQSQQGTKMPPRYRQRHRRPGSSLLSKPTSYQDAASSANKSITPGFASWQSTDSDIEDLGTDSDIEDPVRHFSQSQQGSKMPPRQPISPLPPVLLTGRVPTATSKTWFVTSLKANKSTDSDIEDLVRHFSQSQQGSKMPPRYRQRHRRPGSSLLSKPTSYQDAAPSANKSITPGFASWQSTDSDIEDLVRHFSQSQLATKMPPRQPISPLPPVLLPGRVPTATSKTWFVTILKANKGTDSDIEDLVRHFSQSQQGTKMPPQYGQRHRRPGSSLFSKPTRYQDAASSANKSITPGFAYWQGTDSDIEDLVRHFSQSQQGSKMPPRYGQRHRRPGSSLLSKPTRYQDAASSANKSITPGFAYRQGTDSDIEDLVRHFSQSQQGSKMPPRYGQRHRRPGSSLLSKPTRYKDAASSANKSITPGFAYWQGTDSDIEDLVRHYSQSQQGYGQRHRRPGSSLLSKPTRYQDAASSANKSITPGFAYWQGTDSDIEDLVRHFSQSQLATKMPPRYGQRHRRPGSSLLSKPTRYQDAASSANKSITPGFAYWQGTDSDIEDLGTDSDIEDLVRHFSQSQQGTKMPPRQPISPLPPVLLTGRVPTATSKTWFVTILKANKPTRYQDAASSANKSITPGFDYWQGTDSDIEDLVRHFSQSQQGSKMPPRYGQRHRRPGSSLLSKPTSYQVAAPSANKSITPGFAYRQGTDSDIEDLVRHFSQSQQGTKMPPRYRQRHRRPGSSLLSKPTRYQDAASSANKSITPGFAYWQGTDSDIEDLVRHFSQSQQGSKMPPRQPISPLPPVLLTGRVPTATSKTWFVTSLKANKGTDSDIEDLVRHFSQSQQGTKMPPRQPIMTLQLLERPWSRVHIDFDGLLNGVSYLTLVTLYSKRPEIAQMNPATASAHIAFLRRIFG
ncbi:hypothetical protein SprV_1002876600 [Sparganum proliferum]